MTMFGATVTAVDPVLVTIDGDLTGAPLPYTPQALIDLAALEEGDRVLCRLFAGRVIVVGRWGGVPSFGYRYLRSELVAASANFEKANYPEARAVRVTTISGGSAGGRAVATSTGQSSAGAGGNGGGWAVRVIDFDDLPASVPMVVGAGGAGGGNATSNAGGQTSFGTVGTDPYAVAASGGGGVTGDTAGTTVFSGGEPSGVGGFLAGDYGGWGGRGGAWTRLDPIRAIGGRGGEGPLGWGAGGQERGTSGTGQNGADGAGYGSGGSGAQNANNQGQKIGGAGRPGLIVLELLA